MSLLGALLWVVHSDRLGTLLLRSELRWPRSGLRRPVGPVLSHSRSCGFKVVAAATEDKYGKGVRSSETRSRSRLGRPTSTVSERPQLWPWCLCGVLLARRLRLCSCT